MAGPTGIWIDGSQSKYPPLDAVVRAAGLHVRLYEGWKDRSRNSGGFSQLLGVVVHHTASPPHQPFEVDWRYCAVGHKDAPVANMLLGRDGTVGIHAGGASNHAGSGGPWQCSRGYIPLNSGNSRLIGIEAQNNGVGEEWAVEMVEAYEILVAALCRAYDFQPETDVIAHFQWAPTRKIDPWGGTVGTPGFPYTGPHKWDMTGFRGNVRKRMDAYNQMPVDPPTVPHALASRSLPNLATIQ